MEDKDSVFLKFHLHIAHLLRHFFRKRRFKGSRQVGKVCEWFVKKLIMPKPSGPTVTPTLYGYDIIVDPTFDSGIESQIFQRGTYEAGTLSVMGKCLNDGDIFIDIGANVGMMSLYASKAIGPAGKVYSFEPQPETYSILKKNIKINGFENICTYNMALGSAQGNAKIYGVEKNRGGATLLTSDNLAENGKYVSINTLDSFITNNDISRIAMIKIDVEGWELEVLNGGKTVLSSPQAPIICIEYSNLHPTHGGQMLDIFTTICSLNNYRVFKLERSKDTISNLTEIESQEGLPSHDNLFCFLKNHIDKLPPSIFS